MKTNLINKLKDHTATIGIVGLGYVGLPLALRYLEVGYPVLGLDVDQSKVDQLQAGQSYIKHIPAEPIRENIQSGNLQCSTDFARAREADALILCVPTPLDRHREPDLSFVISSLEKILPHLCPGQVVYWTPGVYLMLLRAKYIRDDRFED